MKDELASKETELGRLSREIEDLAKQEAAADLSVDPGYVVSWLTRLEELIESDPVRARAEVGRLIGDLQGVPVSQDGETGLMLTGEPKIEGILGVVAQGSTGLNGGGRIRTSDLRVMSPFGEPDMGQHQTSKNNNSFELAVIALSGVVSFYLVFWLPMLEKR